jgi:hypothetical protein
MEKLTGVAAAQPKGKKGPTSHGVVWAVFLVLALVLCVVLAYEAPGILGLLILLGTPIAIRFAFPSPAPSRFEKFMKVTGMPLLGAFMIVAALVAAFLVVCTPGDGTRSTDFAPFLAVMIASAVGVGGFLILLKSMRR